MSAVLKIESKKKRLRARPVLRYHGGKWLLAKWIVYHYGSHRKYVEPYGGAASPLMRKPRSYAEVYNDLDSEIVGVFRVLRDPAAASELERRLRLTPFARDEFVLSYQYCAEDLIENARRVIFRSCAGFGSAAATGQATGFRAIADRSGTIPSHDWMRYPDHIARFTERLQGVVIENRPAMQVIASHDNPDTLFYIDPTYVHSTRSQKTRKSPAYRFEMTDDDHGELAGVLRSIQGKAIVSGYPSALYEDLYKGWRRIERPALADGARSRTEVIWLNYSPEVAVNGV